MAKIRLSGARFVKYGYGQVEDNHLSAPRNGQVYGQLPAAADINVLENGMFVKYDYAKGVCTLPSGDGQGPIMMVLNEIKLYRDYEVDADFAMIKENYAAAIYNAAGTAMPENTTMVPRVFKMSVGDIYTTNCVNETALSVNNILVVGDDGYLEKAPTAGNGTTNTETTKGPQFQVVKVYTMPDGQPGVKLQCIAE